MKARKFFAFVAGAAMLFGGVACTPDAGEGDTSEAEITVSPATITTKLEGGEYQLTVTSNGSWVVNCDQSDVVIAPSTGANNGVVTVTIPSVETARNFSIKFVASKEAMLQGIPYTDTDEAVVSVYQNAAGNDKVETNVKAVRALLKALEVTETKTDLTDELKAMTLIGIVVAEPNGNMSNDYTINVQDDSVEAGSGLTVYSVNNAKQLKKGDVIKFSLASAQYQYYKGLLQLVASASVEVIAGGVEVTPIDVAVADLKNYEAQYVKVSGLTPAKSAVGKVWNSSSDSGVSVNFTTADGNTLIVRVNKTASFKNDIVPAKSGYLCGVAGVFNSDVQLMPQYASDIQLTEDAAGLEAQVVTIAEITKTGTYKVENAWVAGFTGNGPILTDASGKFINTFIYENTHKTIGEKVTVEGDVTIRQGSLQFDSPTVATLDGIATVEYPTPATYEGAALEARCNEFLASGAAYLAEYVELKGLVEVAVSSNGTFYNLVFPNVDGSKYVGSLSKTPDASLGLDALNGKTVILRGFLTDYAGQYISIVPTSVEETTLLILSAENITGVSKDGVVDANAEFVAVGVTNVYATCDGEIVTTVSVSGTTLTYSVSANNGEAREGWIKLSADGVEDVTIVVKQKGTVSANAKFEKVTGPLSDYTGTYLIVYDGTKDSNAGNSLVTLNASLGTGVDVAGNFVKVSAETDGSISATEANLANVVEIAKIEGTDNYSVSIGDGIYIGSTTGDKNEMKNSASPIANSVSVDASGVASITSALDKSVPVTIKFYSNSSGSRFRYYKSTQKTVSLYKLVSE